MDGATCLFTEARVGLCVVQIKFSAAEEVKLVNSEAEFPRDVGPMDGRGFVVLWGFLLFSSTGVRHGVTFKYLSEWVRL